MKWNEKKGGEERKEKEKKRKNRVDFFISGKKTAEFKFNFFTTISTGTH